MKTIVWDLFGGLNGSVGLSLDPKIYKIYTIDILDETKDGRKNIVIDLADSITMRLFAKLDKLPKPDIIVASPMCQSFSRAAALKGGNASWRVNNDVITYRKPEDYINTRYNYTDQLDKAILGETAIQNTISIIRTYKPKHWYIENPASSLIWKLINYNWDFNHISNIADYSAYGFISKKPTIFLSNTLLDLKTSKQKSSINTEQISQKQRSDIPKDLIRDIFDQFNNPRIIQPSLLN